MYTYFVKNNINSLIKIGKATNVQNRLVQLKGQISFVELSLFHYLEGDYEDYFHSLYENHRKSGEWFDIPNVTVSEINTHWDNAIGLKQIDAIPDEVDKVSRTDTHFRIYDEGQDALIKCNNSEKNLIFGIIKLGLVAKNTNEILLNKARREQISKCAGVDVRSLQNSLYRLIKKNLIVRHKGIMLLNPKLFFSGDEKERNKLFELRIQYHLKQ